MTCIAASRIGNTIVIGADTLITTDSSKVFPKNFTKLIEFPHFIIGFAGDCMAFHVLNKYRGDISIRNRRLKSVQEVYNFARKFYKDMTSAGDSDLLIVTDQGKIYKVCETFVEECDNIGVIGSGKDLAFGYLLGNNDVEAAIDVACQYNTECGKPIHLRVLKFE